MIACGPTTTRTPSCTSAPTAIRLDSHTALAFLNLDDRMTQVRLSDGTINITIRHLDSDESYEIDTPNGAVTLLRPGKYRIDADPERADHHGHGARWRSGNHVGRTGVSGSRRVNPLSSPATKRPARKCARRYRPMISTIGGRTVTIVKIAGRHRDTSRARWSVMKTWMTYGAWRDEPGYGHVWVPRTVAAGWAPYRYGHWAWVEPVGLDLD